MAVATEFEGRLADNIVHFARALRKAGVRVGPGQVQTAISAVRAAGFTQKTDFYHTLRATLITRPEHLETFHQIFAMFWRDPEYLERMIHMLSPTLRRTEEEEKQRKKRAAERRAAEALTDAQAPPKDLPERQTLEVDAQFSWSPSETLKAMDFEQMSTAELTNAARAMQLLDLPVRPVPTRRMAPALHGTRIDTSATLRAALRRGGDVAHLARRAPLTRPPDLVALCDISGSMSVYSRMLLRFLHAMIWTRGRGWAQVHAFTFGTRLTNISRALGKRDADDALAAAGIQARDWEGGTRIGDALARFNRDWSRRVLGQGATVLLITDGLERGDTDMLSREAKRLSLSCRHLVWLNPLLRWEGFAPRAAGIRALLPCVDSFHACHSLDSLEALSGALSGPGEKVRLARMLDT